MNEVIYHLFRWCGFYLIDGVRPEKRQNYTFNKPCSFGATFTVDNFKASVVTFLAIVSVISRAHMRGRGDFNLSAEVLFRTRRKFYILIFSLVLNFFSNKNF